MLKRAHTQTHRHSARGIKLINVIEYYRGHLKVCSLSECECSVCVLVLLSPITQMHIHSFVCIEIRESLKNGTE